MALKIKRIHEPAEKSDGTRILVDRIWPKTLARNEAEVHLWVKSLAPSNALRLWYSGDPTKWEEFRLRYFRELDEKLPAVADLLERVHDGTVTLLYAATDDERNYAAALAKYLRS